MTRWVRLFLGVVAVLLCASVSGCLPSGQGHAEEEKEPHFLAGKACVASMDYNGAIEEFEKALEVNPHSAAANFQLGWLYEEKEPDPAAAIYHYEQYLKLRPRAENAEIIRQHINNCKRDLARSVLPLPVTPGMQRQFEQVAEENRRLRDDLDKWRAYAAHLQSLLTNRVSPTVTTATRAEPAASPAASAPKAPPRAIAAAAGASGGRVYVVKAGDSAYSIARRNNVKLEALMAANPGLEPRRLRIGQTLNIPAP